jgi:hypothetical protein
VVDVKIIQPAVARFWYGTVDALLTALVGDLLFPVDVCAMFRLDARFAVNSFPPHHFF